MVQKTDDKKQKIEAGNDTAELMSGEECALCHKKTATYMQSEKDIPYFGRVYVFSVTCENPECKYHKADIESAEQRDPVKYSIEISGDADMHIRVIKSSEATVKIPHVITITPGPASNGYVTNVEGILNRVKSAIESAKTDAEEEDSEAKQKARKLIKKLNRAIVGQDSIKIIIEDPSGNSAIISEKAVKEILKGK